MELFDTLDAVVRWTEERFGRGWAWVAAIGGLLLIVGIMAAWFYIVAP